MKNKIAIIANRDDVLFLKPFEDLLKSRKDISKVYYTDFFTPGSNKTEYAKQSFKLMSKMFIAHYMVLSVFKFILRYLPISLKYKKNASLVHLCQFYGLELIRVESVNSPMFISQMKEHSINTLLSITSQIYKTEILNIPNLKIYNFHPSLLPNNKGRFPIFWAIMKNERNGLSCHVVNEKIDDGEVINQIKLPRVSEVSEGMNNVFEHFGDFISDSIDIIDGTKEAITGGNYPSFYGATPKDLDVMNYKLNLKQTKPSIPAYFMRAITKQH